VTLEVLAWIALICAGVPELLFLWNWRLFRPPPRASSSPQFRPAVSVLIPARNEEHSIAACVESVLSSIGVQLEVIVLDDHSDDGTAVVVQKLAEKDPRVRLEAAPPLPAGWCGKQHACYILAKLARYPVLSFLDADVRLTPEALARMARFLGQSRAGLVSGFPRQEAVTFLEKLIIPLIHWLMLCYLPMIGMRRTRFAAFGVGCGQWFVTTREAYEAVGGHAAIKSSLHDGITLPRAYRKRGYHTDVCDATALAVCRMYRSGYAVWNGFTKNAREGMATTLAIPIWTALLLCGHVLPFVLLPFEWLLSGVAVIHAVAPRIPMAIRFRQPWLGVILHPISVLALLAIQWYAIYRAAIGKPVGWKGRPPVTRPGPPRSPGPPSP
jgi:glycosyltransferase involved in cell wall biosynthesis